MNYKLLKFLSKIEKSTIQYNWKIYLSLGSFWHKTNVRYLLCKVLFFQSHHFLTYVSTVSVVVELII